MNILLLQGPNLNMLGEREPEVYGTTTMKEIHDGLSTFAREHAIDLRVFQSNHEGELIDRIQHERKWLDAMIFNPGAFTHYSYALRDVVAAVPKPMIEVHLSDPAKRGQNSGEAFRLVNVFAGLPHVTRIAGKGAAGYLEAIETLLSEYGTRTRNR